MVVDVVNNAKVYRDKKEEENKQKSILEDINGNIQNPDNIGATFKEAGLHVFVLLLPLLLLVLFLWLCIAVKKRLTHEVEPET